MEQLSSLPWERVHDRSPVSQRIAASVARAIVERRRPEGDWLTEGDLAAAENASRTPAREAMLLLEAWGLVRLLPKKGAIVTSVTEEERRDLLVLREMFEVEAVRAAVAADALGDLGAGLRAALDRQQIAVRTGDVLEFAAADYAFHAEIIRAGGNSVILELLDTLAPRLARVTYLAVTGRPDRAQTLLDEHAHLAELATAGDHDAFAAAVREHISAGHFGQVAV